MKVTKALIFSILMTFSSAEVWSLLSFRPQNENFQTHGDPVLAIVMAKCKEDHSEDFCMRTIFNSNYFLGK